MKLKLFGLLIILVSTHAFSAEYATVISVRDLTETRAVPSQECHVESVPIYGGRESRGGALGGIVDGTFGSAGGLIGAIAGGYIGSKFGKGNGRRAATIAGAALGAQMGDSGRRGGSRVIGYEDQYVCNDVVRSERVRVGYLVSYDYRGQLFEEVLNYRPAVGSRRLITVSLK